MSIYKTHGIDIGDLVQNVCISIDNAIEIPQLCKNPAKKTIPLFMCRCQYKGTKTLSSFNL